MGWQGLTLHWDDKVCVSYLFRSLTVTYTHFLLLYYNLRNVD